MSFDFVKIGMFSCFLAVTAASCSQEPSVQKNQIQNQTPSGPPSAVSETPPASSLPVQSALEGVGVVRGAVHFSGAFPIMPMLDMSADPVCAASHSEQIEAEALVVNPNRTLRFAFVYIKEGLSVKNYEVPKEPAVLDQTGCRYVPHVLGLQTGQELVIANNDGTLHNVHGMPQKSKEFNLGMPVQGMKLKREFLEPEVMVKFKCDVHPWMSAFIGILPHPFFSVTGEDGTFEIKRLPAGNYTLEVWHEMLGIQTQPIEITPNGETVIDFTFQG